MIKSLFESGAAYAIVASIAGLGLIFRIMEIMALRSIVSKKDKKEKSNGKRPATFLTYLKTDYTKKYLTGKKVNNVDAFVDKHMINREFCGLSISTYKKICGLISIITVAITLLFGIWGKLYGREENEILSTFFVGLISMTLLISVDCLIGYEDRIKRYRASLISYIENEYSYYISADEGVQKAAIQTLASRQKKILMEEKENERKTGKGLELTDINRDIKISRENMSGIKDLALTEVNAKSKAEKELDLKEMDLKALELKELDFEETKEIQKTKEPNDAMLIDEILKGIFAQ